MVRIPCQHPTAAEDTAKFIPGPYEFRSGVEIHHCSFKFLASCLEDFLKRLDPKP